MVSGQSDEDVPKAVAHGDAGRFVPVHLGRPRRHVVHHRTAPLQSRYVVTSSCILISLQLSADHPCSFPPVSLSYERRTIAGRPPSARGYHASLLADSRLFVFGGFNGNEVFDDVHMLELAGAAYLPQVTSFTMDVE